jgi:phage terminase large subunit-like protein
MEAHYVWGLWEGKYHLLDRARNRGHQPNWTVTTALELGWKWRVMRIVFEAQAYQRTIEWLLKQEMARRRTFFTIRGVTQHKKKFARIENVIGGLASNGLLAIGVEHVEFLEQFQSFGPTYNGPDDDLDASAIALEDLSNPFLENADPSAIESDVGIDDFPFTSGCP